MSSTIWLKRRETKQKQKIQETCVKKKQCHRNLVFYYFRSQKKKMKKKSSVNIHVTSVISHDVGNKIFVSPPPPNLKEY